MEPSPDPKDPNVNRPDPTPRENRPNLTPEPNRPDETLDPTPAEEDTPLPDELEARVGQWKRLEYFATQQGIGPFATEILAACRYDALLDRVANLEVDTRHPFGQVDRGSLVDAVKVVVESNALDEATRLLEATLVELSERHDRQADDDDVAELREDLDRFDETGGETP